MSHNNSLLSVVYLSSCAFQWQGPNRPVLIYSLEIRPARNSRMRAARLSLVLVLYTGIMNTKWRMLRFRFIDPLSIHSIRCIHFFYQIINTFIMTNGELNLDVSDPTMSIINFNQKTNNERLIHLSFCRLVKGNRFGCIEELLPITQINF